MKNSSFKSDALFCSTIFILTTTPYFFCLYIIRLIFQDFQNQSLWRMFNRLSIKVTIFHHAYCMIIYIHIALRGNPCVICILCRDPGGKSRACPGCHALWLRHLADIKEIFFYCIWLHVLPWRNLLGAGRPISPLNLRCNSCLWW